MSDSQGTPDFEKKPDQPTDQPADQPTGQPSYGQQPYAGPPQPYGAPQPPPYVAQPPGTPLALPPDQERLWGGAAHWSALVASIVGLAFLGPLIVMLTKGNESAFVRRQAVESLNFQLSMLIYAIASSILILLLVGILLLPIVVIMWLVFTIIASVKASNGEEYRYPLTIRMVS
jgi:uncharacterized protein